MRLEILIFQLAIQLCVLNNVSVTIEVIDTNEHIRDNVIALVRKWAPIVRLSSNEQFFPTTVTDFLNEVTPLNPSCIKDCSGTTANLPIGSESAEYYMFTNKDRVSLLKDSSSFLYGTNPTIGDVPVYAHVRTCNPNTYEHFIVTYWFFYPFNEGKNLCSVDLGDNLPSLPIPRIFKQCMGYNKRYGDHVGDWEHMSLEIEDSIPKRLYLSVHDVGLTYLYNREFNRFTFRAAKSLGLSKAQNPPPTIWLEFGHPILFAARGSHALWASPGVHMYTKFRSSQLVDETDYGHAWETWNNLQVFYSDLSTPRWYFYEGRWGNPRSGCLRVKNVDVGVCHNSPGPKGLSQRLNVLNCPNN